MERQTYGWPAEHLMTGNIVDVRLAAGMTGKLWMSVWRSGTNCGCPAGCLDVWIAGKAGDALDTVYDRQAVGFRESQGRRCTIKLETAAW